ncbi:hypothetical protein RFI_09053, partial [Reticulomyxa filosa]
EEEGEEDKRKRTKYQQQKTTHHCRGRKKLFRKLNPFTNKSARQGQKSDENSERGRQRPDSKSPIDLEIDITTSPVVKETQDSSPVKSPSQKRIQRKELGRRRSSSYSRDKNNWSQIRMSESPVPSQSDWVPLCANDELSPIPQPTPRYRPSNPLETLEPKERRRLQQLTQEETQVCDRIIVDGIQNGMRIAFILSGGVEDTGDPNDEIGSRITVIDQFWTIS